MNLPRIQSSLVMTVCRQSDLALVARMRHRVLTLGIKRMVNEWRVFG